jgi:tetratricopeptide (TPR) repeat protein
MKQIEFKEAARRPPVVIAALSVFAVVAFLGVNQLVGRFREQQKAVARHLFAQAQREQQDRQANSAIEDFRTALLYDRENFEYQLTLARALRDAGQTNEAESYLMSLWEADPQSSPVNLALGRLAARLGTTDKAIRFYHNAMYGVWPSQPEASRIEAQFELIEFLVQHKAFPQAESELITLSASPIEAETRLRAAGLFARTQDYEYALAEYRRVLQTEKNNHDALAGAGEAAFKLGRYRTAESYLRSAADSDLQNARDKELLHTSELILQADPFARHLSSAERNRRLRAAFEQAGKRLDACVSQANGGSLPSALAPLKTRWVEMQPRLKRLNTAREDVSPDQIMDLVGQIEQQAATQCGAATDADETLVLLAQDREGAER